MTSIPPSDRRDREPGGPNPTGQDVEGAQATDRSALGPDGPTPSGNNDGPTAVAGVATTDEDSSVTIDVLANDSDPDTSDSLTVTGASITGGLGSVSIVGNQVVYDPGTDYNDLAVGESAVVTITWRWARAPSSPSPTPSMTATSAPTRAR